MFDLSDVIDRIDYTIDGKEEVYYLEDQQDLDGTKLSMYLLPRVRLIDYIITVDDEEVLIEEINATLRYDVTFNFSKLDVVTEECEFTYDVKFDYVFIDSLSDHENLEDLVASKIISDIHNRQNFERIKTELSNGIEENHRMDFEPKEFSFKPVLKKLQ